MFMELMSLYGGKATSRRMATVGCGYCKPKYC